MRRRFSAEGRRHTTNKQRKAPTIDVNYERNCLEGTEDATAPKASLSILSVFQATDAPSHTIRTAVCLGQPAAPEWAFGTIALEKWAETTVDLLTIGD